jgi:heterodisulfide reductase subunit A
MKPRVGVFVCNCGTNIGGVVNVADVVKYASKFDGVAFAEEGKWICSVDYLSKIKEHIAEHKLNRVVVACCTPRTHEPTFKSTIKEAGLNPYLLEFVSIREQSSWVHKSNPKLATEKAKDLVKMGIAKAILLEPGEDIRISVGKNCLIIGGGLAGMTAALAAADQGFKVDLIEKNNKLGGILNNLDSLAPFDIDASEIINDKLGEITKHSNIKVHTNTELEDVKGYIGNYKVKLSNNGNTKELETSTIIAATGMNEIEPEGLFGYGDFPNIITQLQLEEKLRTKDLGKVKNVAIINCVNSRNEERGCCNIGCLAAIKNAVTIKELNKDAKVYIFYRDINIEGEDYNYFKEAVKKYDIKLIRYPDDKQVEVAGNKKNGSLTLKAYDILIGKDFEINPDLVVLTTGFQGDPSVEKLKGLLKVSASPDRFFQEAHIKLRPLDFANDGIYLCGCARNPKDIRTTIEESLGAAMRAGIPMKKGYIEAEGIVADINKELCNACGLCAKTCAFGAIEYFDKTQPPNVIKALCKGCGTCAAECPTDAINIIHYTNEQILAQVDAALAENPDKKIIAFCCHWCALGAVDLAGVSRFEYPENIQIIRVLCSGRVDSKFIEKALELKAAGVLVAGCEFPTCHYINGNDKCKDRVERLKKKLDKKKIDTSKIWDVWLSAADGAKFVSTAKNMVKELKLGR